VLHNLRKEIKEKIVKYNKVTNQTNKKKKLTSKNDCKTMIFGFHYHWSRVQPNTTLKNPEKRKPKFN
jgi:hypothetical protein